MIRGTDHFGPREAARIVVDLFWDRCDPRDEFCVEVRGRRDGTRCVVYPAIGREAIRVFHYPFPAPAGIRAGCTGPGLTRYCCLRQEGQITAADTTRQPSTIGLIRGLWVTRSVSSGGSSASRALAEIGAGRLTQPAAPHKPKETDHQNHRPQPSAGLTWLTCGAAAALGRHRSRASADPGAGPPEWTHGPARTGHR